MVKKTALYERHVQLGARMVEFAGWLLPVQYPQGPLAEHHAVRQGAGLFDIDHMGQVIVEGPDALVYMQFLMTADVGAFAPHSANYSLMCYDDGGIVDDTFIYALPEHYFIAFNAANNAKDTRWMNYHRAGFDVEVRNVSDETYMLALQGPRSPEALQPLCDADLTQLTYHTGIRTRVAGVEALVGRTGYTGEDGFELFFPSSQAEPIWDQLLEAGAPVGLAPVGLAARDSLRFEPCMPLYGQEISADIDPYQAGLGWAVSLDKDAFLGREALLKARLEGTLVKLVGFQMTQGGVPRHGYEVAVDDVVVGEVTSGMFSPTLQKYLGLAYVPTAFAAAGTELQIIIRDKPKPAVVVKKPFYAPRYFRRQDTP